MTENFAVAKPIEILLVEDSEADAELTREALSDGKIKNTLTIIDNGEQAIKYLKKQGDYTRVNTPDIVLLDLNLPIKSGFDVLKEIKADSNLKKIPVIVLTTSESDQDILKSYDLHANSYMTKPVDLEGFMELVKKFEQFWFMVVKLPTRN